MQAEEPAKELIANNCLSCHSEELLAQQRLTAKQWAAAVKKMQGWGAPIEAEHVEALVAYLAEHFGPNTPRFQPAPLDAAAAAAALAPLPDGKFKGGSAAKGKSLYQTACLSCHGADAHGSPTGMNLADRPLLRRAPEFAAVTRAGKGRMPAFATLSNADVASLLAYLRGLE
ncbi:MAG TPA: c-type cytochrome [Polyangia bacterium]|nr:c-type cytochrome [Polyangia bacterium]